MSYERSAIIIGFAPSVVTMTPTSTEIIATEAAITSRTEVHVLGAIGGSSLFHAKEFSAGLEEQTVATEFGGVVVHVGMWKQSNMKIVFIQRHHADPDGEYKQPRKINFKAIAMALKLCACEAVIGIYSVGSMNRQLTVGRYAESLTCRPLVLINCDV